MSDITELVTHVDALTSVEDDDSLAALEAFVDDYFAHPDAATHLDVWFRLFERFPEDDGYGIFWSVLHGLEDQPGVDSLVVASVRRNPSQFPVLMIQRMRNADTHVVDGVDLADLLRRVADDATVPEDLRDEARHFLEDD